MNDRPLRHVAFVLLACFSILFVQLNRIQVFQSDELKDDPSNTRTVQRDFKRPRGPIVTSDGVVVAHSVEIDGPWGIERQYPEGDLYAHVAGFLSFTVGASGVERAYNDELVGRTPALSLGSIAQVLGDQEATGEVVMTVRDDLQRLAREGLAGRRGSVVVLDPRSGEVLAMWSGPSFDPNLLSGQDGPVANEAYIRLLEADGNPLRAKAFKDIYFPGSTFKIVTAAAALSSGAATLSDPVFAVSSGYTPPLTSRPIANYGGRSCGGNLLEMLRSSCNTGMAELGAAMVGPDQMIHAAQSFGFNVVPPFDLPGSAASNFPTDYGELVQSPSDESPAGVYENTPALAQASIGQNEVAATPLQMALVAAAVANDGVLMKPHVVSEIRDVRGRAVTVIDPSVWQTALDPAVAADLKTAMIEVVEAGSGTNAQVPGVVVGGKTGTAQLGSEPPTSHAWFIAFAGIPDADPELAIAILLEADNDAPNQTGGGVAAPIARSLIEKYFEDS